MANEIQQLLKTKLFDKDNIRPLIAQWKDQQQKLVFTNGCFDIVHVGHLNYLLEASKLGQKLLIGLNSDASVKRLKGCSRPINGERDRAALLASLFFVDAVVLFEEDTPLDLIKAIEPDVLVKGGDYAIDQIVGAKETLAQGGSVEILEFLPGYSTTNIVSKIRGAQE
ncbi:D-glycero-beta-D-manno-heptose 1-phosphate adenylyltransferase [Olivibacter sp. XZL3]|uniref:D-glycero-beta-D-manno-heptose 1-phosphate adenylyltransferase n=1 Tax=Olivibacter sp. XZL3 TaxID=1735116 RepID=UPI001066AF52|nr:D-glycero-beta-D-manno-heptose 1-phosphate adenylyltransferase [Olivibacter sp. XZL3]